MNEKKKPGFKLEVCPATSRCASHHRHLNIIHNTKLTTEKDFETINCSSRYLRERCLGIGALVCNDFILRGRYGN